MAKQEEHRDDMVCRLEVQRLLTPRKVKKFIKNNKSRVRQLLTTYSEDDANHLLGELREMFWNEL